MPYGVRRQTLLSIECGARSALLRGEGAPLELQPGDNVQALADRLSRATGRPGADRELLRSELRGQLRAPSFFVINEKLGTMPAAVRTMVDLNSDLSFSRYEISVGLPRIISAPFWHEQLPEQLWSPSPCGCAPQPD